MNQPSNRGPDSLVERPPTGKTQFLDIDPKVAAYTTYIPIPPLNVIMAGVWFAMEPSGTYAKFHATQSLIFSGGFIVAYMLAIFLGGIVGMLPFIGGLIAGVWFGLLNIVAFAYLVVSIICMIKVNKGEPVRLPYISDMAEQFSRGI